MSQSDNDLLSKWKQSSHVVLLRKTDSNTEIIMKARLFTTVEMRGFFLIVKISTFLHDVPL